MEIRSHCPRLKSKLGEVALFRPLCPGHPWLFLKCKCIARHSSSSGCAHRYVSSHAHPYSHPASLHTQVHIACCACPRFIDLQRSGQCLHEAFPTLPLRAFLPPWYRPEDNCHSSISWIKEQALWFLTTYNNKYQTQITFPRCGC